MGPRNNADEFCKEDLLKHTNVTEEYMLDDIRDA